MVKEVLIGVGGVVAGAAAVCAIYALVIRYKKALGITPERAYFDEININEIKRWFSEKINLEDEVGVLFYPTEENLEKWKLDMDIVDSVIIQIVYNQRTEEVVSYREIAFGEMSTKLKTLLDSNGGTIVLEK